MKAFFDDRQRAHDPKMFMANGTRLPNPEQPARIEALRAGAEAAGCTFAAPTDHGPGPLAALLIVVGFGTIRIHLDRFAPEARPRIVAGETVLAEIGVDETIEGVTK